MSAATAQESLPVTSDLIVTLLQFLGLAGVIIVAGTFLAKYADAIGELTGLGGSLAGIVLLASATSLPELAVDCSAAWMGAEDLAVGTLFGSSLFNLLILAAFDLSFRSRGRMLSPMAAAHALSATMSMVLTAIALLGILLAKAGFPLRIGQFPIGVGSMLIGVSYLALMRLVYFDQQYAMQREKHEGTAETAPPLKLSLKAAIIGYVVTTLIILVCGPLLARTADHIASISGLGRTFIGTTLVALSTSLPEIVTTLSALRMGAVDLAIGNVFGSNSFNMTILLAVDFFSGEPVLSIVSFTHAVSAAMVLLCTAVAISSLLYRPEKRLWIIEPDAALMALLIFAALYIVYVLE